MTFVAEILILGPSADLSAHLVSQVLEKADGTPEKDRDEEDSGTNM